MMIELYLASIKLEKGGRNVHDNDNLLRPLERLFGRRCYSEKRLFCLFEEDHMGELGSKLMFMFIMIAIKRRRYLSSG
jgi:hypothetical protein